MATKGDVEVAETLPPDDALAGASSAELPASWGRYELLEPLGKGGMGVVYKARDRVLDRTIAIKFILNADPNLTMRFVREARAQAKIVHPNICTVHDAGEVGGRAYIALQLIAGEPLHKAAARMSLEEKIGVMHDVAAAVHEAHRLQIVHRDLKPGNVMVERTAEGSWFPVVMDFGLARDATVHVALTESGVPLGTLAYMSPEQARGDVHAIDRRSDVYSLGATLYELLTGQPPFPSPVYAEALVQVIQDDPPAPRSLVPSLPLDLETIALKCLAKDPIQRYPSARALANDLRRYLDGEPILGRRVSAWQRLRLRARRQRALFVLGAWSLVILVVVATLAVREWIQRRGEVARTAERTALARRLGQSAMDNELSLRMAYLLPLHDMRPERERVRARMRDIAATRHDLGALGDGAIHEALGRGYLALHEWEQAADELERAIAARLTAPELHAARGRALVELYHRALKRSLEDARQGGAKDWAARRRKELEQQYLTPAMEELKAGLASADDTALIEAQIALNRRDFATAEARARAVADRAPELFEARKLAADAAYGAALGAFDRGDYAAAHSGLDRAAALYAEASDVARSDASLYEAAAQTWLQRAQVEDRQAATPRESLERALDVIERALRADPEAAPTYTTKAYILLRWYETPKLVGADDKRALLERIAQVAERAVEIDPFDEHAWDVLGNAHNYRGNYEVLHEGDGVPWYTRAIDEFGKALFLQPNDLWANNDLGVAYSLLGTAFDESGRDPMPLYKASLQSYERAAEIDPQYLYACTNQVDIHTQIADCRATEGIDPQPAVDRALRIGERCVAMNPSFYVVFNAMARAQLALARYLVETGGDPTPAVADARRHLDRADAVHPRGLTTWHRRLTAAVVEANYRLRERADPSSTVATGRAALDEILRQKSDYFPGYMEAARLDLVEAIWAARTGRGPNALFARALADAEKAIALGPLLSKPRLAAAELCLQFAKVQPSRAVIDRGIAYLDDVLMRNPQHRKAKVLRVALEQQRAP